MLEYHFKFNVLIRETSSQVVPYYTHKEKIESVWTTWHAFCISMGCQYQGLLSTEQEQKGTRLGLMFISRCKTLSIPQTTWCCLGWPNKEVGVSLCCDILDSTLTSVQACICVPARSMLCRGACVIEVRHEKTDLKVFVVVIPKVGWARMAAPILLLVWHQLFRIWVFWLHRSYSLKVGVIPKEGWSRPRAPILLLVWQRQRP